MDVRNLIYKGVYEYVNPVKRDRYIIFNYICKEFTGELIEDSPEGKQVWVHLNEVASLPMQESIRRRFPLFLEEGTFEIYVEWDEENNREGNVTIKKT